MLLSLRSRSFHLNRECWGLGLWVYENLEHTCIIFGYNQAGAGPLATLQSWVKVFPQIDTVNTHGTVKPKNSTGKGAVIAAFQIGALIGALSCTFISERLGRRKTIFCGAILTIIGQLLQTSAFSLIQFTVA